EAHLPVVGEDQEDDAVVEALLPDAPGLRQSDREVLEALTVERFENGHHDLIRGAVLAVDQFLLELLALCGGERPRLIGDAAGGRWGQLERGGRNAPGGSPQRGSGGRRPGGARRRTESSAASAR